MLGLLILLFGIVMFVSSCQENRLHGIFKNIVGGEIHEYTKLQADSREEAIQRMIDDANTLGADAVVGVRLATSMVTQGAAEILAYGTAVKLK